MVFVAIVRIMRALASADTLTQPGEDPAKTAITKAFGTSIWEMLQKDDNARLIFDAAMEQQVQGAGVYHIRRCLHDWSDTTCERILRNIRNATKPGYSQILIYEFVLPVVGAEQKQRKVLFDILMM